MTEPHSRGRSGLAGSLCPVHPCYGTLKLKAQDLLPSLSGLLAVIGDLAGGGTPRRHLRSARSPSV